MRPTPTRLSIRKPLWVYEHTRSLDKLHGKKLAKVTHLHTLLVLNVLKMLEATSFEKINTVKNWTRMKNKQCNGVKLKRLPDFKKGSVVLIERCSTAISSTVASVKFLIFQDLAHRDVSSRLLSNLSNKIVLKKGVKEWPLVIHLEMWSVPIIVTID
ncbi:uncharacterized protein LOC114974437 isoform X2 [Acropora millepora]|uniref:uncharacterized protein LOC114974437 isoform X2 n=1 Tax=Acropora millepora TaxID=45264 RepID=UPI001CF5D14D|nr:uncharacterized protein LOC114974437 isoform X2 [Acropora millepora]